MKRMVMSCVSISSNSKTFLSYCHSRIYSHVLNLHMHHFGTYRHISENCCLVDFMFRQPFILTAQHLDRLILKNQTFNSMN